MVALAKLLSPYKEGMRGLDRRVWFVVTMTMVSVASRMGLYTFLGIYFTRELGLPLSVVGLAYLLENVGRGVLAPLAGALSDRVGRRPVLVASAAASAAVLPLFLYVGTTWHVLAWGLVLGIAQCGLWPATSALLLDLVPEERRQTVLAVNYTALSIGYTLGVAPAGFLAMVGYPVLAAASAAGFVVIALLYVVVLRGPLPPTRAEGARSSLARDLARAPRDPAFVLLAALGVVFPLGIGLVTTVSPVYAADAGLSQSEVGLALALNGPLLALFSIPVAAVLTRYGPYRHLAIAGVALAASYVFLVWSGGFLALVGACVVFSLGELVFSSSLPTAVASLAPAGQRGAYQGAWSFVHAIAVGGAFFLTGLMQPALGWRTTWIAWTAVTLLAALGLALARPRFRRLADARAVASS